MSEQKKEILLKYPITVKKDDQEIVLDKLVIGRFKLKLLKYLPENFSADNSKLSAVEMIPLIGGMCGLTEQEAGEIDFDDLDEIAKVITDFLPESPKIGKS